MKRKVRAVRLFAVFGVTALVGAAMTTATASNSLASSNDSQPTDSASPLAPKVNPNPDGPFASGDSFLKALEGTAIGDNLILTSDFLKNRVPSATEGKDGFSGSSVRTAIASSDGITVIVTESADVDLEAQGIRRAFPAGVRVSVVPGGGAEFASQWVAGSGIGDSTGSYCSTGLSALERGTVNPKWYTFTAGHCSVNACGVHRLSSPFAHSPQPGNGWHVHSGSLFVGTLFPLNSAGSSDESLVYAGTGSVFNPPPNPSKLVYSPGGIFGLRYVLSASDLAFLTLPVGTTFESYGHTVGSDTQAYLGISPSETVNCAEGTVTLQYFVVTNTGASGCIPGDSGGPLFGTYYPFDSSAKVSVLGTLSFSRSTIYGRQCFWSQPGFALEYWGLDVYHA